MTEFIPVNEPLIGKREKELVLSCLDSGWISSEGSFVSEFEQKFSKYVDRKFGIAVSSGTAAIDIAVESLGIKKGDEIILPSFTIISCVLQIVRIGAIPIFIDSSLETWNIDILEIEKRISNKTKALLIPHIYGLPVDMNYVQSICQKYNLKLIEDAAEMIGQTCRHSKCGSFGEISTFSFYANKHITTGEGGMIVTDSEDIYERCKSLRNLCFQTEKRFIHENLGWNYRMTNIQAALGLAQIERLDEIISRKREIGKLYNEGLQGLDKFFSIPMKYDNYAENIYWVFGIVLKNLQKFKSSKELSIELKKRNIGSRPFFYPLHLQPILQKKYPYLKKENLPNSKFLYDYGLYLPSGLALSNDQIIYVCKNLKEIFTDNK